MGQTGSASGIDLSLAPYDVLVHILCFVDHKTQVFSCRLVNSEWRQAVESESLRNHAIYLRIIPKNFPKYPWYFYYHCANGIFGRNLLRNPCGYDKLDGWSIVPGTYQWEIESPPIGCSQLPEEMLLEIGDPRPRQICCFVSSYRLCANQQIINLNAYKIPGKFMDEMKPVVKASVWYASRFDCGAQYRLTVQLLDSQHRVLKEESFETVIPALTEWDKAEVIINEYQNGVRFIKILHKGKDTQYWAGNYGVKVTLAKLTLTMPLQ